ncbi:MAG: FG-GAP repeat protein [Steroidobacteraceae bacterium]
MRIPITKICSTVFAFVIAAQPSSALADLAERRFIQTLHPELEELPLPQSPPLHFGLKVAVQDDVALVGAEESGHAAVFTREDKFWRRTGALPCAVPMCTPVALQDNVAVVVAADPLAVSEAILIFRNEQGTWSLTDSIAKPLPDVPDLWVRAVRFHDGIVAVTVGPTFSGTPAEVFLYELDANAQVQRTIQLAPSDPNSAHNFGSDIAMGNGVIAVGDSGWSPDANGPRTGAVYVFKCHGDTWMQSQILTGADSKANDEFGRHLAIEGNLLLVSATNATRRGTEGSSRPTGAVYAFERTSDTWVQSPKLAPSPDKVGPYFDFGADMAISGRRAVIAAKPLPYGAPEFGLAFEYLLLHDRFALTSYVRRFAPPSLALDGSTLLAGSAWDNAESPIGHVAVYDLNAPLQHKPFCATAGAGAFCDAFESGTAENWQSYGGAWTVESREYVGRAGVDQCGTGFSSNETLIRHLDAADVDVRLEMRSIQRVDKGVILRSTAAGDQIELNFRSSPFFSDLVVQELVGCQFNFLESASIPHEMGEVLQVRIRLVGQRLTVWVKQRLVLNRELPFHAKRGGVGLAVITDQGVSAFDNVRVKVLK